MPQPPISKIGGPEENLRQKLKPFIICDTSVSCDVQSAGPTPISIEPGSEPSDPPRDSIGYHDHDPMVPCMSALVTLPGRVAQEGLVASVPTMRGESNLVDRVVARLLRSASVCPSTRRMRCVPDQQMQQARHKASLCRSKRSEGWLEVIDRLATHDNGLTRHL